MGKGTDKLYITHSEWSSSDAYSASAGSGVKKSNEAHASFKRLPFTFCALSLQPFASPVCTSDGLIFDHENILRWLITHDTNPVNGKPLKSTDLIKLQFAKNDTDDYVDPVTFKVFTDNTHIVAIRHGDSANVFAFDTVERLNIKAKMWWDLVSDEEFSRKDILTLQDPQNLESRDLSSFKYIRDGEDSQTPKEEATINTDAMGSSAKIIKAKEAVLRARAERASTATSSPSSKKGSAVDTPKSSNKTSTSILKVGANPKSIPYNASNYTTGLAAASLTSTGVTPHTSATLALLSEEEYLLKPRRVKQTGYVRLETTHGALTLALFPEYAPKAVWNFIRLSQKGYYDGVIFHRNIRSFMIQGGDPTGTGRGGSSIWAKNFADELDGPLRHSTRGVLSMANKGKDSNSSQFFITYRPAPHLDRKHTVFGHVVFDGESEEDTDDEDVLRRLEAVPVVDDKSNRPKEDIRILRAVVLVDPFEDFQKEKASDQASSRSNEPRSAAVGANGDANTATTASTTTTWTGKRVRGPGSGGGDEDGGGDGGVGKYLKSAMASSRADDDGEPVQDAFAEGMEELEHEPAKKKVKKTGGGFGNFDSW